MSMRHLVLNWRALIIFSLKTMDFWLASVV